MCWLSDRDNCEIIVKYAERAKEVRVTWPRTGGWRLNKMLAIFDDQKPVRHQGKVINLNKKILWRKDVTMRTGFGYFFKVQNSINQINQCSVVTFQSPELTAQHTPVKINTEKQIWFLRRKS